MLWIKLLLGWYFSLIHLLSRLILRVSSCCITIFRFLIKSRVLSFASSTRDAASTQVQVQDGGVVENELAHIASNQSQLVIYADAAGATYYNAFHVQTYYKVGSILEVKETLKEANEVDIDENPTLIQPDDGCDYSSSALSSSAEVEQNQDDEDSIFSADDLDTYPPMSYLSDSNLSPIELDLYSNENLPPICLPDLPVDSELMDRSAEEEVDSVYVKYEERMKWFDILSHDRVHGIDAITNKHLGSWPGILESMVPADLSMASASWSEKAREKIIRSLKSDLELVYVAHSCLSWDALHHQYRKVEAIANSSDNRVFHKNTAERFQEFQILLERFMEDEHFLAGQRYSNYVRRRFTLKKLLQVPQVSAEKDRKTGEVMIMNVKATQVLKIIENCIKVFWLFVKADTKKSSWKIKNVTYTHPPVEDPRDLELLYDLRMTLRKKEILMKNLEGKRKCWWKRRSVNPPQFQMEYEKEDFLFTMIDLKLVKKVLQMSTISTSQLKWCQKKLCNVQIGEGKIYRTTQQTYMFPSSSSY